MSILDRDPDEKFQVINEKGQVVNDELLPSVSDDFLREIYEQLITARVFDERAVNLQRQGRMGTFPPLSGQEAAQVGSAIALDASDWAVPSYREHAVSLTRGLPINQILQYWMGDERGNQIPSEVNVFPVSVPIATQIPHAVGMALAAKHRGDPGAVMVFFGDGATSEGDFHEGMNFAGVFDVPCVFMCNNNQYAISVPRTKQTASATLAQKAEAYGFTGIQVDGMDVLAVYAAAKAALSKAKNPRDEPRPTLVEAVQYRFGAHTTADDPSKYRPESEVDYWRERDPIVRFETFLTERGVLDSELIDQIRSSVSDRIASAIESVESTPRPEPTDMFQYVYETPPEKLIRQRDRLESLRQQYGDDELLED